MGFDDLTQRMGRRHGVAPALLADPAALTRRSERNGSWALLLGGIALVVGTSALTIGIAAGGWWMPEASMAGVFAGGLAIVRGAKGLR